MDRRQMCQLRVRPGPYMVRQSSRWIWIGQGYGATNRADGERATTPPPFHFALYLTYNWFEQVLFSINFLHKKYFIFFVRSLF